MTAQNRRAHTRRARARAAAAAAEGNDNPERVAPPLLRPLLTFAEIRAALSCLPDGDAQTTGRPFRAATRPLPPSRRSQRRARTDDGTAGTAAPSSSARRRVAPSAAPQQARRTARVESGSRAHSARKDESQDRDR